MMQIDFYILETESRQKSLFFACGLLEKIEQRVYIHTDSLQEAERIEGLLWTYKDDSFLPHNIYHPQDDCPPHIQIGYREEAPINHQEVLLNLSANIPLFYVQFVRVMEIVFSDALVQQSARERYKQYRDQGYAITTHKLKADEI